MRRRQNGGHEARHESWAPICFFPSLWLLFSCKSSEIITETRLFHPISTPDGAAPTLFDLYFPSCIDLHTFENRPLPSVFVNLDFEAKLLGQNFLLCLCLCQGT